MEWSRPIKLALVKSVVRRWLTQSYFLWNHEPLSLRWQPLVNYISVRFPQPCTRKLAFFIIRGSGPLTCVPAGKGCSTYQKTTNYKLFFQLLINSWMSSLYWTFELMGLSQIRWWRNECCCFTGVNQAGSLSSQVITFLQLRHLFDRVLRWNKRSVIVWLWCQLTSSDLVIK